MSLSTPSLMIEDARTSNHTPKDLTKDEEITVGYLLDKKDELELLRQHLEQQLSCVNTQIIQVQSEYGTIFNKRCTLLNLPVEVTCLIFQYALTQRIVDEDSESESQSSEVDEEEGDPLMEVVITHVCHSWRTISVGYQKLWSSYWYNGVQSKRIQLDRFEAYMERSGTQPLHLWFDFREENAKLNHHSLIQSAIAVVSRWERITIFSENDNKLLKQLRQLNAVAAPMLQYFALYIDASCETDDDGLPITSLEPTLFTGGAPKLTFALLDSSFALTLPPLDNLTILRIEKGGMVMLHGLRCSTLIKLLSLPKLIDVSLAGEMFYPPDDSLPVFEMPQLQRFRVGETDDFWAFLQRMRAPQLHTLIIFGCDLLSTAPAAIQSQDPYSFPSLSKIWLLEITMEVEVAKYFVKMTSAATEAFITHDSIDLSFLTTIVNNLSHIEVWPHLKTLTCNIEGITDMDVYIEFAKSRPKKTTTLRLHKQLVKYWKDDWPNQVEEVKACMKIEEVDEDFSSGSESFWPADMDFPPFYIPEEDDHFAIESYCSESDD